LAVIIELGARVYATVHVTFDKGDKPVWSQVRSTKDLDR
jgi:hypothetical protein